MTLGPKYQRYAERLRELTQEAHSLSELATQMDEFGGPYIGEQHDARLHAWFARTISIVERVFGTQSYYFKSLNDPNLPRSELYSIRVIIGVLDGALDDLEKGYLTDRELLIAAEVFDSVLKQAKHLNGKGYKDPAAVLMRVVLEDALRRLAREESIDDSQRASVLNDGLKKVAKYPQPQWRLIKTCLDVGNAAAHGRFDEYDQGDVERRIEDVERFLATEFRA